MIPEIEAAQSNHAQRIRQEYYGCGIYPKWKETTCLEVEYIHKFDEAVVIRGFDYTYQGAARKRSLKDEVKNESHWTDQ